MVPGKHRCVDVRDRSLTDDTKSTLQGGERQRANRKLVEAPLAADRQRRGQPLRLVHEDRTKTLSEVEKRHHVLGHGGTEVEVDGIQHQLATEGGCHAFGDRCSRLVLGLSRRSTEMRGDHHSGQLEEWALRRRFDGVHVDGGAGDGTFSHCGRQGILVDDAAPGSVDDPHTILHLLEGSSVDQPLRLGGTRHMDGQKVCFGQQFVKGRQLDTEPGSVLVAHVWVVRNDAHPERGGSLGDHRPDPPQPENAEGLAMELDPLQTAAVPPSGT